MIMYSCMLYIYIYMYTYIYIYISISIPTVYIYIIFLSKLAATLVPFLSSTLPACSPRPRRPVGAWPSNGLHAPLTLQTWFANMRSHRTFLQLLVGDVPNGPLWYCINLSYTYIYIYIHVYILRTVMTLILEALSDKIEVLHLLPGANI